MRVILVSAFTLALVLALLLTLLVRRLAPKIGLIDHPEGRKLHSCPIPHSGGIAISLATCSVLCLIIVGLYTGDLLQRLLPLPSNIGRDVELAKEAVPFLLYIIGGGLAIALLGLIDDIRPLSPGVKLALQALIISAMVISSGLNLTLFIPFVWARIAVTILWILLLTNSFNLLDNMDGLSGSVALVCGFSLLICALATQQYFIAGLLLCLLGAVLGFLFFNLPPASIFMGDSGSMFVGFILGTAGVLTTFLAGPNQHPLKPLLVPLIIFSLPLYDTFSVIIIRIIRKKSIFSGDTNHFSHRLLKGGMSQQHVLLTVVAITVATSLGATMPYCQNIWLLIVPAIQVLCLMFVLVQLEMWKL